MKSGRIHFALALLVLSLFSGAMAAQDQDLRNTLFAEADAALAIAKKKMTFLLAPESFQKGYRLYRQAEESLKNGRNLASIQRDLNKAIEYLEKSLEVAKLGEVTFADVLKAREDAYKANSLKYAEELWKKAETKFVDAGAQLEDGDVKDAQKLGAQAEQLYRGAELDAIKGSYLNETKTLLARADDLKVYKYAPKTLQKAKMLLAKAEQELTQNRYDIDQPRDLARQAKYEANHAIYLAKRINEVLDDKISLEGLILEYESPLVKIGGAANLVTELDQGYEGPTEEIVAYIENLQSDAQQLRQDLSDMENKFGSVSSERESLRRLEAKRMQAERIENMFTRDEASVLRRGEDIILRLVGLNFSVNKSEIEARNFPLLVKVQNAIKVFPGSSLVIEGHTDSFGTDSANLSLSKKRAESVRQYLIANMNLDPGTVSAVGYGESRPVANNETPEGRTKNRRIDIIIRPAG
jgi:outer membrane protein OmpA-like peptidoglycan-associated protein